MHFLQRPRSAEHWPQPRGPAPRPAGLRALGLGVALALLSAGVAASNVRAQQTEPLAASPELVQPAPTLAPPQGAGAPRPAPVPVPAPTDLRDLSAWLDYRARSHLVALPLEARLFYRQGLMAEASGNRDEAVRLLRGAGELDPSFVAPHLTLASWLLFREPSQALLQYASVLDLARDNFLLQVALAGNALYLVFQSLLLGLLAAGLLLVGLHHRELRHTWGEQIARFTSPASARWWTWAFLVLPFVCGLGLALPTVVLLALLWPSLRVGERAVSLALLATLAATPWALGSLDRLSLPLRDGQPPFYGVALVATDSPADDRQEELAALARQRPGNPFIQFAAAWTARRHGDLASAEAGYRRALELWPGDDRVLNNLGNTLAMQGRTDEALEAYRRAAEVNPANAGAAFNASQIHTQRFDYHAATDALSRASSLNFDLVKTYQSQATDDGVLPLVDEWIAPRAFWAALSQMTAPAAGRGTVPPAWRSRIESSGWPFSIATLALAAVALLVAWRTHRRLPLRSCANCGAVVCRRCACRRREAALCPTCAALTERAETPEFGRVLLLQHRQHLQRTRRRVALALAMLIPGFGMLSFRRVVLPVLLLSTSAGLLATGTGLGGPFSFETRFTLPGQEVPLPLLIGAWLAIYAVSVAGYVLDLARADAEAAAQAAPIRSRIRISSRDHSALAA